MALLARNRLRLKPHHAELAPGIAGCVPALIALTLPLPAVAPMPIPMPMCTFLASLLPTISIGISVIDGEEPAKGLLTEVARIIESPVAV